jgi:hypothetical protein
VTLDAHGFADAISRVSNDLVEVVVESPGLVADMDNVMDALMLACFYQ